ncbi:EscU/YscU/HrcU family type III secretion system export apparatus switch protein [Luteithermobacter gelatinilyticus]|uniref:EscU/YscU/HrcU family type III secretion system export apparatus switch protein n=1 Tax=Luteithermobacter gelatinilyticus TaxID=2582913 RepID=UPI0011059D97|nr:EscU/YscU/HrcU family type III secretion system export apparatus switch protein [Luteithermobacter gelatinilyticus]|tara:strand:+ start:4626 stop:5000 length:375 start_codon:yes stop_codon:yes gene_type:complete
MTGNDAPFSQRQKAQRQKAVALSQAGNRENIPRITATGFGANAEKILELAFASGVKVRQDEDLVSILSSFDEGSLIPLEALQAVSEILSYLYNEPIRLQEQKYHEMARKDQPPTPSGTTRKGEN